MSQTSPVSATPPTPDSSLLHPSKLHPSKLHCKYLEKPIGIGQTQPRPSWGYSIRHGATTIWDDWTSERGFQDANMNSFNHCSLGSVGRWLYQTLAGIDRDPVQPGFEHIVLRPQPGGITHASATLQTPCGTISSATRPKISAFNSSIAAPVAVSGTP